MEVLHQRFAEEDARFRFPDMASCVADSGPAVVAFLAQQGVLVVPGGVPESDTPPELECALRAAAVVACHALSQQLELPMGGVGAALARRCADVPLSLHRPSTVAW